MKDPTTFPEADLLIRKARIVWPDSPYHGKQLDISVKGGIVDRIDEDLEPSKDQELIDQEGLHISPGWTDMNTQIPDPGHEEKESLDSGINAALNGGYSQALLMPSMHPPIDHKGAIEDLRARSRGYPFSVLPVGCISKERQGADIAELYDMHCSGAKAFSDARAPITDNGLLTNALWYSKTFDGRILLYPDDPTISRYGTMHEGALSMRLGMKGIPSTSERIAVDRALHLLRYTEGRIHFSTISTKEGISSIREAKKEGLRVTCDVPGHHLFFDEEALSGFSSAYKVMPPLRERSHVEALMEGVKDGTVDHISSLHEPQAEENKRVEFDVAAFGIPGLETCFGAASKMLRDRLSLEEMIRNFAIKPREILGLDLPTLEEGSRLDATLFEPDRVWTCRGEELRSKAYGSPYIGKELLGKPLGVVHDGRFHFRNDDGG